LLTLEDRKNLFSCIYYCIFDRVEFLNERGLFLKFKSRIKEIELTVPMIPDMELAVTKTIDGLRRFIELTDDHIDEVKHAIIEACINNK